MLQEKYAHQLLESERPDQLYKYLFNDLPENKAYYQKSINQTVNAVIDHLETRSTPYSGASVDQIRERFSRLQAEHPEGNSLQIVLEELKELYLNDAISFHNTKYVAHLNCPILIPTLAAEVIISAINTSMDTWDQSAGGTFIELKLIEWTLDKIGYPENADGVFTSGGTQSNMMGLLLARDHFISNNYSIDPGMDGLPAEATKFRIFCSEVSHFSLKKNAALLGLGQNSVVSVAVNDKYQMDTEALEEAIIKEKSLGNIPIAVVGTAGTTDFGSIDPLYAMAAVADQYKIWFHVDAAYGGGLILSDKHKEKLKGIELSDSATIDYHKTFFQPVSSSGFFMRDKSYINYIKYHADYLNSKEQEEEGIPNMVKKSIQTTRRFDALKLWVSLRTMGTQRLGQYIDDIIELAQRTSLMLRNRAKFEVLNHPEISAVVFRYNPLPNTKTDVCALNAYIRKSMFDEGKALIASTKVEGKVYLKFTLLNPVTQLSDMQEIVDHIERHGHNYFIKN
ncbi:pyridoxal phosphate-dependent decarboxylase family protein [Fulvivirga sediminis]|uniref:Aspartate aminotransferase family protein n=1 Tax=Fulvivirga sediminis TaxID=2803949 RepID=A0A937F7T2_9BACT|nr:aspartate aminotransferase family protein [Fulvivirga sediminis]MBL3655864.1 aspartate aminotransferase family protein [Fulvivirga sediminis]